MCQNSAVFVYSMYVDRFTCSCFSIFSVLLLFTVFRQDGFLCRHRIRCGIVILDIISKMFQTVTHFVVKVTEYTKRAKKYCLGREENLVNFWHHFRWIMVLFRLFIMTWFYLFEHCTKLFFVSWGNERIYFPSSSIRLPCLLRTRIILITLFYHAEQYEIIQNYKRLPGFHLDRKTFLYVPSLSLGFRLTCSCFPKAFYACCSYWLYTRFPLLAFYI